MNHSNLSSQSPNKLQAPDLHHACRSGDLFLIKSVFYLRPAQLNTIHPSFGWTPLFGTVLYGYTNAAEFLLQQGADPDIPNTLGESPLHQAVEGSHYRIASLLLYYKAHPNLQQSEGNTALHRAALKNDHKMLKILLKAGADPNLPNFIFKQTPMHLICEVGDERSVLLMIKFKGDLKREDSQGNSPETNANPVVKAQIHDFFMRVPEVRQEQRAKLYYWLMKLGLVGYYEKFEAVGYTEQKQIIDRMRSGWLLTEEELKKMGISKLGHRFRILVQLEEDAGIFQLGKNSQFCLPSRKMQFSKFGTLESWLKSLKLSCLKRVFEQAGYENLAFILAQMKSRYPISDEILERIGIGRQEYRNCIIHSLVEETKEKKVIVETLDTKASCSSCIVY